MKPFGLRTKLTLTYVAVFALVLAALGTFAYQTLASRLASGVDVQLEEMAAGLRGYVRFADGKPLLVADANDPEEQFFLQTAGRYLEIYDVRSGELLYQSHDMEILNLELSPTEVTQAVNSLGAGEIENERILLRIHNSLFRPDASRAYLMRVGFSLLSTRAALQQFRRTLLLLVPVVAVAQQQKKPPAKPPEGWKLEPFSLTNKSAGFEIALHGYLQADFRSYQDWQVGDGGDDTLRGHCDNPCAVAPSCADPRFEISDRPAAAAARPTPSRKHTAIVTSTSPKFHSKSPMV